jgi:probable HAF family extracellular repeat protein
LFIREKTMKKRNLLALVFVLSALFCLADSGVADTHAFLYSGGAMTDLGTLGGTWSEATGINDSGQIVGRSWTTTYGEWNSFLYSNGKMTGFPGGQDIVINNSGQIGLGRDINNNGQIVGSSGNHAASWSYGSPEAVTDLGTLGGAYSSAYGINDSGLIVGGSQTASGQYYAFSYLNGTMTQLETLPGATSSIATGVNNSGQIVGWSLIPLNEHTSRYHSFLYSNGTVTDLGSLTGAIHLGLTYATGINDSGQVCGYGYTAEGPIHAFSWLNGVLTDLGTLGGEYSYATGINNRGQIVGYSELTTGGSGVVPIPSAVVLLGAGLVRLAAYRRKLRKG